MKKVFGIFLITISVFIGFVIIVAAFKDNKGIVILDEYEHGVAFCEEEYHTVVHQKDASVWADGTATYVINNGHYNDPQVKELIKLAHNQCAQFKEK